MDRTNNAVGIRIGIRARTPLDVLDAARFEIERAAELGAGTRDAATWLPVRIWGPTITTTSNWPPRNWPDFGSMQATLKYEGVSAPSRYRGSGHEGPVHVRPHMRDGHPVHGYVRGALAP